jgi:hypothetical protein
MGGIFSGRWHDHRRRRTVEGSLAFDFDKLLRAFKKAGKDFEDGAEATMSFGDVLSVALRASLSPREHEGRTYDGLLTLSYTFEEREASYGLLLSSRTPNYGGRRYFVHCMVRKKDGTTCLRRASKLYLPRSGGETFFACRECHRLSYKSVQEHDKRVDELVRNLRKLQYYASSFPPPLKYPTKLFLALKALKKLEERGPYV